jgi:F-type H+-transporting ATPase subunit gamma
MANLRDLRKRRRSASSTRKITRTMELVASAKLKKAQDAAASSKPYAEGLSALVSTISAVAGADARHPLMTARPVKKVLILLAASDRGLCGAFNVNLAGLALERRAEHLKAGREVEFIALGKKGGATLAFSGHAPRRSHTGLVGTTRYEKVLPVAEQAIADFLAASYDQVEVVYARFVSAAKQLPDHLVLLPAGGGAKPAAATAAKGPRSLYEFLPSAEELLGDLIPRTVRTALFSCLLQTSAAEHAARRLAMKNASDAAGDMITHFTRAYNRGRQSKITQEIAEIVGAVEAMA